MQEAITLHCHIFRKQPNRTYVTNERTAQNICVIQYGKQTIKTYKTFISLYCIDE